MTPVDFVADAIVASAIFSMQKGASQPLIMHLTNAEFSPSVDTFFSGDAFGSLRRLPHDEWFALVKDGAPLGSLRDAYRPRIQSARQFPHDASKALLRSLSPSLVIPRVDNEMISNCVAFLMVQDLVVPYRTCVLPCIRPCKVQVTLV